MSESSYGYWCRRCKQDVKVVAGFPECKCTDSPSPWQQYKEHPPTKSLFEVLRDWWFPDFLNPGAK